MRDFSVHSDSGNIIRRTCTWSLTVQSDLHMILLLDASCRYRGRWRQIVDIMIALYLHWNTVSSQSSTEWKGTVSRVHTDVFTLAVCAHWQPAESVSCAERLDKYSGRALELILYTLRIRLFAAMSQE